MVYNGIAVRPNWSNTMMTDHRDSFFFFQIHMKLELLELEELEKMQSLDRANENFTYHCTCI